MSALREWALLLPFNESRRGFLGDGIFLQEWNRELGHHFETCFETLL